MTTVLQLRDSGGLELTLMDRGATWLSCLVPLPDGSRREVLLGCATPQDYERQNAYLGATVGRYANRIRNGHIARAGKHWALALAPGARHHLHGGPDGFDRRHWRIDAHDEREVRFALISPDGDQGYPGELHARVAYRLLDGRTIEMETEAQVSAPSPVCLTNHAYFNLDVEHVDVRAHELRIAAAHYLPVDAELIPLGELAGVAGSSFDFRTRKSLARDWLSDEQQRRGAGYDHAFLLDAACADLTKPAATLWAGDARLSLSVHTNLPSVQLYAGQFLNGVPSRAGVGYSACAGVALEPQFLPDSPNHPEWPQDSCWLEPGQIYRKFVRYCFSCNDEGASST